MNQPLTCSVAAPAVYPAMLALQASVEKSGLEKDLMDLCAPAPFHISDIMPCPRQHLPRKAGERVRWLSHGERSQDRHDVGAVLSLAPRQIRMWMRKKGAARGRWQLPQAFC